MSEFIAFTLGGIFGVVLMCCLQINRLYARKAVSYTHLDVYKRQSSDRHNYRITEDTLGVGGAKEKFRNNMAAIQLLHELELEHRLATPEEQEVLARYVGWGGLSMAFDENNAAWAQEFKELNASLSPEEYRAAMESTLTAFYTCLLYTSRCV